MPKSLVSQWYECSLIHRILDTLTADMSSDETQLMTSEGSQAVMGHTLRGIYRTLFEWMANARTSAGS